ncbi:hypothetical protein B0H34DRAFT_727958 [Crassisporium funariophilum]|nr:hypothetical protein B0H34DRAFT_727958 [Crassisporium funariophilum]
MHLTNLSLGLAFLVASTSQVLALVPRSPLALLIPRQSTCETTCADFSQTVSTCTTVGCLCTDAVAASLQACINCAIATSPTATVIDTATNLANTFQTTCSGLGVDAINIPISASGSGSSLTSVGNTPTTTRSFTATISQSVIRPPPTESLDNSNPLGTADSGLSGSLPGLTGGAPSIGRGGAGQGVALLLGVALGIVAVAV